MRHNQHAISDNKKNKMLFTLMSIKDQTWSKGYKLHPTLESHTQTHGIIAPLNVTLIQTGRGYKIPLK